MPEGKKNRRHFLTSTARTLLAGSLLGEQLRASEVKAASGEIPYRSLGKTGQKVSLITLGGAHIGYEHVPEAESIRIMHAAIDEGVNFFDNSWDYNGGISEERMGKALAMEGKRQKVFLMTKFCCHRGDRWTREAALEMLEQSLRRLRTDYLDLWQLHEVIQPHHPEKAFQPGSAIEAMLEARQAGKVRFLGFTGHRDPDIHLKMLSHDFPFDTVQMPLNVLDAHFRSFEKKVLPVLLSRGIGVIGMKPLGGGARTGAILDTGVATAEECLRYAMNLPVSTVCTGIISMETMQQALSVARKFQPFEPAELTALLERTRSVALEGTHERYKASA